VGRVCFVRRRLEEKKRNAMMKRKKTGSEPNRTSLDLSLSQLPERFLSVEHNSAELCHYIGNTARHSLPFIASALQAPSSMFSVRCISISPSSSHAICASACHPMPFPGSFATSVPSQQISHSKVVPVDCSSPPSST
jgi:hypothetical protein